MSHWKHNLRWKRHLVKYRIFICFVDQQNFEKKGIPLPVRTNVSLFNCYQPVLLSFSIFQSFIFIDFVPFSSLSPIYVHDYTRTHLIVSIFYFETSKRPAGYSSFDCYTDFRSSRTLPILRCSLIKTVKMGKKNKEKVKEKKAAHKAHLAQLSASQSRVAAANALQDPLAPFSIFHKYDKNSIQVSVDLGRWGWITSYGPVQRAYWSNLAIWHCNGCCAVMITLSSSSA